MSPSAHPKDLNNHHQDTLLQLFGHPTSHNVEWRAVLSLLEAVGSVEPRPDGKYLVQVGADVQVLPRPNHKDIDIEEVLDVRRMLTSAGYGPVVEALVAKGKED